MYRAWATARLKQLVGGLAEPLRGLAMSLASRPGKGLRAALVRACAPETGPDPELVARLGAVVELIHLASLLHDDVVDRSATRRGAPAAHTVAGPEQATLAGFAASGRIPVEGIAYKDKPDASKRFLAELGNPYQRVGVDADGRTAIDFGLYGVPETYLVDANGMIRFRWVGPLTPEALEQEILPRLAALQGK